MEKWLLTGLNSVKKEVTTLGAKSSHGVRTVTKQSRSKAQSESFLVVVPVFEDTQCNLHWAHLAITSAMMPMTPPSVDWTAMGLTWMELQTPGEQQYFKQAFDKAVEYEKAGEKLGKMVNKLVNERAVQKGDKGREAEIKRQSC